MTDTAIKVDGLGKRYLVGHNTAHQSETFREMIVRNTHNFMRKTKDMFTGKPIIQGDEVEEFWALQDVSFEIKQGDRVGIIGRNGAGKSTLLKVLSRITEPTNGRIEINGRVASLLEVGTGFHPELTGRENIFLNGAILGMSRKEIQKKFDEIVAFAEVEKFLDTPVKRYSSGMYVRLAFAVAAHLEPEILIVDEVLAVGDTLFQTKCLGKMEEIGRGGKTVLFVSHNLESIKRLCSRGILLDKGHLAVDDSVQRASATYLQSSLTTVSYVNLKKLQDSANEYIEIENISIDAGPFHTGGDVSIRITYRKLKDCISPAFVVTLKDENGVEVLRLSSMPICGYEIDKLYDRGDVSITLKKIPLVSGNYTIDLGFVRAGIAWIFNLKDVIHLHLEGADIYGSGFVVDRSKGLIVADHKWEHYQINNDKYYVDER